MHIGTQLEAPEGLGGLDAGLRYYFYGKNSKGLILLIRFYLDGNKRWRAGTVHLPSDLFERELLSSPPGLRSIKHQYLLPPAIESLSGINFSDVDRHQNNSDHGHENKVEHRMSAILPLLDIEDKILNSTDPLKTIVKAKRDHNWKTHAHDLQYWFFAYVLHGRNKWALKSATHENGTWSRTEGAHINKKFGRQSVLGKRNGWSSAIMREEIIASYLKYCGLGKSMQSIYNSAIVTDFGCNIAKGKYGKRKITHRQNKPFPSYGQFSYVVTKKFGINQINTTKYGQARMTRLAAIDKGNTTGDLANFMESIEIDAYYCEDRPLSYRDEVMPPLIVARAIDRVTSARVGIGFSLGGEKLEAYRSMLWSMSVDKSLVADLYGIPISHLDWPMQGISRTLLSDNGPASQLKLIEGLEKIIPIKSTTPKYSPKSKPNVESSNPRSFDPEGAPTYVQSDLHVGAMMKREVLRACAENRSVSIVDRLSPDMIIDFYQKGIPATPQGLVQYLEDRLRTNAVKMHPDDATRIFLRTCEIGLDRIGAVFNGLHYNSEEFQSSGKHENFVKQGIKTLQAYTLPLVSSKIWIECEGKLFILKALRRIKYDDEELHLTPEQVEDLAKYKKILKARTREVNQAAKAEFHISAKDITGQLPQSGKRKTGRPGRGKDTARQEANTISASTARRRA